MIGHPVNGHDLVLLVLNDGSHVLVDLDLVFRSDERLPSFDGEDSVDVDLGVCVSHNTFPPFVCVLDWSRPGTTRGDRVADWYSLRGRMIARPAENYQCRCGRLLSIGDRYAARDRRGRSWFYR